MQRWSGVCKKADDMTRKSCYKPIKAFIYIEFLAYDEDAMGNLRGIIRMCEQVAAFGNTLILYSA